MCSVHVCVCAVCVTCGTVNEALCVSACNGLVN